MGHTWVRATTMVWILMFFVVAIVTQQNPFALDYQGGMTPMEIINAMKNNEWVNTSSGTVNFILIAKTLISFIMNLGRIALLWYPSLWTGMGLYFYVIFIAPVAFGNIYNILSVFGIVKN